MGADPMKGKTVRWTYDDGAMKGKTFEHRFGNDGTVTWKEADEDKPAADSSAKYEYAPINDGAYVFSYLAASGFTLTTIVDEKAGTVVSFASNEKDLFVQHGRFDKQKRAAS
jgi:hypothetical protein